MNPSIEVDHLRFRYKQRIALKDISFTVNSGEIFGLLGPNGGGKSTAFRILCTFFLPESGSVRIEGHDVATQPGAIRKKIGVVFQSSSLDRKLTVQENMKHQGHLYGLKGELLRYRISELLKRFGIADRAKELAETLSGGLRRRVEIAKAMLHRPSVLLLDEPSTGLDPSVRLELWNLLKELQQQDQVTVLLTTHFMEEAERCDRLAVLDQGELVSIGSPDELKQKVGGEVITIHSKNAEQLCGLLEKDLGLHATLVNGSIRLEVPDGRTLVPEMMNRFSEKIEAITFGKPTLEDVFIHFTGHGMNGK
jgi:ABC-2 type transport system ATP-binding protein